MSVMSCLFSDRIHDRSWWKYVSMLIGVTTAALVAYSRSIFAQFIVNHLSHLYCPHTGAHT